MTLLSTWLAKKAGTLIALAFALAALVAVPSALYLNVQLNGFSLFGWHLVDGARKELADAIEDKGKIAANYTTCQGNEKDLRGQIADTNARLAKKSAEDAQRLKDATGQLAAAQAQNAAALARLRSIMAAPPMGKDVCARVQDVDRRFLETLP